MHFIALASPCIVLAQNMVVNPSFENYNNCPGGLSTINFSPTYTSFPSLQDWVNPTQKTSPDYFHTCAAPSSGVHIPEATFGYQRPKSGDAYAGIILWEESAIPGNSYRFGEYLETKLLSPMIAGNKYCVSFYVSPTIAKNFQFNYMSVDEIGAHFSASQISNNSNTELTLPYHIVSPFGAYISDTNSWTKITGIYTSTGGEQWMTIGRFNNTGAIPNNILAYPATPNPGWAFRTYMYIDDVGVYMIRPTDTTIVIHDSVYCDKNKLPMPLNSRANDGDFVWNTGQKTKQISVSADGLYWCRAVSNCAVLIDTFIVRYQPDPSVGLDKELVNCNNSPVTITPKYSFYSYQWSTGEKTQTITVNTPGIYWCKATNSCGTFTDTVRVYIQSPTPAPIVKDTMICQLSKDVKLNNVIGENLIWYNHPQSNIGSEKQPYLYTKDVGFYKLYVTQKIGKCESEKVPVNIDIKYQPRHVLEDKIMMCEYNPQLIGIEQQGVSYYWSNGSNACCIKPDHEGLFRVTTKNECGTYTDSMKVSFSLCDDCISVPNAFTPNDDGLNDKFFVIKTCPVQDYHIRIFNRWGEIIFESKDPNQPWNGTRAGVYVEQGTYIYILEYRPESTKIGKFLKGNINVLR